MSRAPLAKDLEQVRACTKAAIDALPAGVHPDVAIMGLLDACVRIIRSQTGVTAAVAAAELARTCEAIARAEADG